MPVCKYCNLEKPDSLFQTAGIIKGIKYYRKRCTDCKNIQQNLRRKLNSDWFNEFKLTLKCERCGFSDYRALQFHHKDKSSKIRAVSDMLTYSKQSILKEISKCEILCANCHQIHHYDERNIIGRFV